MDQADFELAWRLAAIEQTRICGRSTKMLVGLVLVGGADKKRISRRYELGPAGIKRLDSYVADVRSQIFGAADRMFISDYDVVWAGRISS